MIWFSHILGVHTTMNTTMKTTLNLNDQVLQKAKRRAASEGITLTSFVEDALRARLSNSRKRRAPFRLQLHTVKGDSPPNVDFCDRNALYDLIDDARG
jgi:hypothetical protein